MAGIKTTSYAENVKALAYAKERGCTEAIFATTTGLLCEGTGSNVFVGIDGRLLTPPLSSGCLAGVTRDLVLEVTDAVEEDIPMAAFRDADEVFLTSTGRDVQPVHRVDDRALPDRRPAHQGRRRGLPPRSSPPPTTPEPLVFTRPPELSDDDDPSRRSPSTGASTPSSSPTSRSASAPTTGGADSASGDERFLTVHDLTAHATTTPRPRTGCSGG